MSSGRSRLEKARHVAADAFGRFSGKGARFLSAAIAFYALLSVAPLLVVAVYVVGAVVGHDRAEGAVMTGLSTWMSRDSMAALERLSAAVEQRSKSEGVLGVLLVLYGSTRLFRGLRRALNQLWGVDIEAVERTRSRLERYGRRYGLALLFGALVVAMVGALAVVKAAWAAAGEVAGESFVRLLWLADIGASVVLAFLLFFALFKVLPETKVGMREAFWSALVSTALFALGSELVTLYLGTKHIGDLYGGAATIVIAVFWVYYSAQALFLGACVGISLNAHAAAAKT